MIIMALSIHHSGIKRHGRHRSRQHGVSNMAASSMINAHGNNVYGGGIISSVSAAYINGAASISGVVTISSNGGIAAARHGSSINDKNNAQQTAS